MATLPDDYEVLVPDSLTSPHPLIQATQNALKRMKPDENGIVVPRSEQILQIRVSRPLLSRALRIYDALIKAWEAAGGTIVSQTNYRGYFTHFAIESDSEEVFLYEEMKTVIDRSRNRPRRSFEPKGVLVLSVGGRSHALKQWRDGASVKIEGLLSAAVKFLLTRLEQKRPERLQRERDQKELPYHARIHEANRTISSHDADRVEKLDREIRRWRRAREIRDYVLAAVASREEKGLSSDATFDRWCDWALRQAARIDPLEEVSDSISAIAPRTKLPITELNLTPRTREAVGKIEVHDTDDLYLVPRYRFQKLCGSDSASCFEEVIQILKGLGYETSAHAAELDLWRYRLSRDQ